MTGDAEALSAQLESLARDIDEGRMTLTDAVALTQAQVTPGLTGELVEQAARGQTIRIINDANSVSRRWWALLFAAIEGMPGADGQPPMWAATQSYLYAAGSYCVAVPDGRDFADATRRGEAAASSAAASGAGFEASEFLHRLGVLHLDPFFAGRHPATYDVEDQLWRDRAVQQLGVDVAVRPDVAMPASRDVLEKAQDYLERALDLRNGQPRGYTLKAYCGVLMWRERLGGPAQHERIVACATEARGLLPPEYHAEMAAFAREFGGNEADDPDAPALDDEDPAAMATQLGLQIAIDRCRILAQQAMDGDRFGGLRLILRTWPLLQSEDRANDRFGFAMIFGNICVRIADDDGVAAVAGEDLAHAIARLEAKSGDEDWSDTYRFLVATGLALSTAPLDREAEGADYLEQVAVDDDDALPGLSDIVALLQAGLRQGAGVNAFNAGERGKATEQYLRSCFRYLTAGQADRALLCLKQAADAAGNDVDAHNMFVHGLAITTVEFARHGANAMAELLREQWSAAIGRLIGIGMGRNSADLDTLWLAFQAAKGAAFAMRLAKNAPYLWRDDAAAVALLHDVLALQDKVPTIAAGTPALNDNVLLASYDSAVGVDEPGDLGKFLRLSQRFDAMLAGREFADGTLADALIDIGAMRELIGPDTVFISQYIGATAAGSVAILTLMMTDADTAIEIGRADLPAAQIVLGDHGQSVKANWFTLPVASARDGIDSKPGWQRTISVEGETSLASFAAMLLGGGILPRLAAWRAAGKRHLCFHPHEALHVLPLHLVGSAGTSLADDWTVTTVPHAAMLGRNGPVDEAASRLLPIVAFGMGYAGNQPHGLPLLKGAEEEAKLVAAAFGGEAVLGSDVTEPRFIDAIGRARRVHIACHGGIEVGAPAFHRLYLQPDAGSDGLLHAFEVSGLDLAHVDLLTLSACETALGRLDALDNQRGLAASFLVAGVKTIVATTWDVSDPAAALFFPTLYARLQAGDDKRTAFRAAQLRTREALPEYWDWGAFQYIGAW